MNLSYVDWYLVEIRRRLYGTLALDQLNSFEFETRGHLQCLVEEFIEQGMDRRSAEIAAIERFGSPENIAEQCVLRLKRNVSRKTSILVTVLFVIFVILVPYSETNYPGYTYGAQSLWIILAFGVFALVLGRMPKLAWFGLPVAVLVSIAGLSGFLNTFYTPFSSGTDGYPMRYDELHDRYASLKADHTEFGKVEHDAAESWRLAKVNAKDLAAGSTLTFPRLVYTERKGMLVYYADSRLSTRNSITSTAGETRSSTIMLKDSHRVIFRYAPIRTDLVLKGPLTALDIQRAAQSRINEAQERHAWRGHVLSGMQRSLNIPITVRVWTLVRSQLGFYLVFIGPASYLVSLVVARLRSRVRFRSDRLKLA